MANVLNAETVSVALPEDVTVLENSVELKVILKKKLTIPIDSVTSSAVSSTGDRLYGMKLNNNTFVIMNEKGNIIFQEQCNQGIVSKDGKKVFLWTGSNEIGQVCRLTQYDLRGNMQWELCSSLPIHLSGDERFAAEFLTEGGDVHPRFSLRKIEENRIIWQRDFSYNWEGYLTEKGNLITINYEGEKDAIKIVLSSYGLKGELLWQYALQEPSVIPSIILGRENFVVAVSAGGVVAPATNSVFVFNIEKGFLWQKSNLYIGVQGVHGLSSNDDYLAIFMPAVKELLLYEMKSGKEIYRVPLFRRLWGGKIDVTSKGRVILGYAGGTIILSPEGKVLADFADTQYKFFDGENILLQKDSILYVFRFEERN